MLARGPGQPLKLGPLKVHTPLALPDIPGLAHHSPQTPHGRQGPGRKPVPSCPRNGSWLLARSSETSGSGQACVEATEGSHLGGLSCLSVDLLVDDLWAASSSYLSCHGPPPLPSTHPYDRPPLSLYILLFYALDSPFLCDLVSIGNSLYFFEIPSLLLLNHSQPSPHLSHHLNSLIVNHYQDYHPFFAPDPKTT